MNIILLYLLKSGLWLLIFGIIYWLFLRKETFFRFNRLFLLTGLIASMIFPLLQYNYTVEIISNPTPFAINTFIDGNIETPSSSDSVNKTFSLIYLYLFGAIFYAVINTINALRIYSLFRKKKDIPTGNGSFSFFNRIFIDDSETQNELERQLIYQHEQAHVDQKHWIDLIICQIVCIIQWFNPFVYMYRKAIKDNHEYLADQAVLEHTNHPAVYKATLINSILKIPVFNTINSFSNNKVNRIKMMKNNSKNKLQKFAVLLILPALACMLWAFAKPEYKQISSTVEGVNSSIETDTTQSQGDFRIRNTSTLTPLYIIDGKEVESIDNIDEKEVFAVSVLKDKTAIDAYGEKGKNGVIVIETIKNKKTDHETKTIILENVTKVSDNDENIANLKATSSNISKITTVQNKQNPGYSTVEISEEQKGINDLIEELKEKPEVIIFVDNVEIPANKLKLNAEEIKEVSVLKGESFKTIVGREGKESAILITTKNK
ncbi:hypothetical protein LJB98_05175 [Bacteroidales bacterium OttesenSCG-928-M11]|nr:hypothetical protein [Bacteroidales bacterium OttesenSCG-928-M11]